MSEKQKHLNESPLWIYSGKRTPDIVGVSLIIVGILLLSGLFSSSPGLLVRPFCMLLRSWFGSGAVLFSFLMAVLGCGILVLRWLMPRLHISRKDIFLSAVLCVLIFVLILGIAACTGGEANGGIIGYGIIRGIAGSGPYGFLQFISWLLLLGSLFLLVRGNKWMGKYVRPLIRKIMPKEPAVRQPVTEEPVDFNWQEEIKTSSPEQEIKKQEERRPTRPPVAFEPPEPAEEVKVTDYADRMKQEKEYKEKMQNELTPRTNQLPPLNLLDSELGFYGQGANHQEMIHEIEEAMEEFGTPVRVIGCSVGPSVIQYQVIPGNLSKEGKNGTVNSKIIRVSQVEKMELDLAVRLGVSNLSIQAPVPGESYIGIDIPNPSTMKVRLRPLIESPEFRAKNARLSVALGRDITGKPIVVDLGSMPHLLVAGTTSSGKSICLRSMAICLAMNNTPEQLRMVMIDPKRVEFFRFNGLPHLIGRVEMEYERSVAVLEWAVQEMKNRYQLFEAVGARQLKSYNRWAEANGKNPLPYIVIFIDEMAEIMKGPDKEGEVCIDKLASLARATGMHLITATQRPDTTIVTGKIKTNIPSRIALKVASATDSRVIMEKAGAEKLLGHGDMYFIDPSQNVPTRIQGALLTDKEIDKVVNLWQKLHPTSEMESTGAPWEEILRESRQNENAKDEKKLRDAIRLVCRTRKASAAYLSGKLNISFPTASRLISRMEELGVVGPMQLGGKAREVIWSQEEADSYADNAAETYNDNEEEDYDEG